MKPARQSFFQRLTGGLRDVDETEDEAITKISETNRKTLDKMEKDFTSTWHEEDEEEPVAVDGQLAIDVFETPVEIIVKTMVPGVRTEDLDISLSRDMLTIRGQRKNETTIDEDDYHYKELYWGSFSRTVKLPHEVDIEKADATENQGMLTLRLPRVDKERQTKLKVKTS